LILASGIIQSRGVEMNRLATAIILAILLAGLILLGSSDTDISVADTSVPDNEVTSTLSKIINYSESGVIMIAWTTPSGEGGSNEL